MDNNIFDLSSNNAEKIYIKGKLHPIRVGMRQVTLQNGTQVILYDTTGVYTDNGYKIDTGKGLPRRLRQNRRPNGKRFLKSTICRAMWP